MRLFRFLSLSTIVMDKAGDPPAGGGDPKTVDHAKEIEALKAQNADLLKKFEALSKPAGDDPDLVIKAKKEREEKEKRDGDSKSLESALRFTIQSQEFIKQNAALLPKDVEDIFKASEKETYDSATEKASALKSGIVQSFFKIQDNVDLLTPANKAALEDYLKLTSNGKKEKAQQIYESVFEPALEMLKRIKKAEHLNKVNNGFNPGSDADAEYKAKIMKGSKTHYLGEK